MRKEKRADAQKAYKYRVYPTEEQRVFFAKCFGCCRKIWNLMLADRNQYYKDTGKSLYPQPAQYKKAYPYLKEPIAWRFPMCRNSRTKRSRIISRIQRRSVFQSSRQRNGARTPIRPTIRKGPLHWLKTGSSCQKSE